MKELCAVFTWRRDELLWLCLEAIRNQDQKIPIVVFSDRGYQSAELYAACEKFSATAYIRQKTIGFGNSYNVIEGLRWAVSHGIDIVHAVEDDTILHTGYLDWARTQLAISRAGIPQFAVTLGRIPADITSTWYEAPCASWNASCLALCLEKVPLGYFADSREEMQKILDAAFPNSRYRYGSAEQDGFFLRCLEFFKWKTAYPAHSYASHLGFFSSDYNRPSSLRPDGAFEERVAFCRKLLYDKQRRIELFGQAITEREMAGLQL
jgi:hypothetical protein